MKKLSSLLLLFMIYACSSKNQSKSEFERFRETMVREGIQQAICYHRDSLNNLELVSKLFYNERGDLNKLILYTDEETVSLIEEYHYTTDQVLCRIEKGESPDAMKTNFRKIQDSENNTETDIEYADDGSIYKSIYKNDVAGRNLFKEYYKDSVLIATYEFDWLDSTKLNEIKEFTPEGELKSRMIHTYRKGLLISKTTYEHDTISKTLRYTYNQDNLTETVVHEVPGSSITEFKRTYKNGLISEETSVYHHLTMQYKDQTTLIWTYKKHQK